MQKNGNLQRNGMRGISLIKCGICGKKGLRVVAVCPDCLKRAAVDHGQIKKLKQLNNILNITADTDGNIKECVQSLAEILNELERGSYGREEKRGSTIWTGKKDNLQ